MKLRTETQLQQRPVFEQVDHSIWCFGLPIDPPGIVHQKRHGRRTRDFPNINLNQPFVSFPRHELRATNGFFKMKMCFFAQSGDSGMLLLVMTQGIWWSRLDVAISGLVWSCCDFDSVLFNGRLNPQKTAAGDLQVLAMPGKCKHGSQCRFAHTMDSWELAGYSLVNVYIAMENHHFNSR